MFNIGPRWLRLEAQRTGCLIRFKQFVSFSSGLGDGLTPGTTGDVPMPTYIDRLFRSSSFCYLKRIWFDWAHHREDRFMKAISSCHYVSPLPNEANVYVQSRNIRAQIQVVEMMLGNSSCFICSKQLGPATTDRGDFGDSTSLPSAYGSQMRQGQIATPSLIKMQKIIWRGQDRRLF